MRFTFQNVRGLGDEQDGANAKLDELLHHIHNYGVDVAMIVESCRSQAEDLIVQARHWHCLFLHHPRPVTSKGRLGIGFLLSARAEKAYHRAGGWHKHYGDRIFAIRLHWMDSKGKLVKFFLASAHAPTTNTPWTQRHDFYHLWQEMMAETASDEILVNGMDANAQLGVAPRARVQHGRWEGECSAVLGPYGLPRANPAGQEVLEICETHSLCAPMSFFRHRRYATWTHPRWRTQHHLDHWLIWRRDLKRVSDARVHAGTTLYSDHQSIVLDFRLARNLAQRKPAKRGLANTHHLKEPGTLHAFRSHAVLHFQAAMEETNVPLQHPTHPVFQAAKDAVTSAANHVLPSHDERRQPGWFCLGQAILLPLIQRRQRAEAHWHSSTGTAKVHAAHTYAAARRALQAAVRKCKREWLTLHFEGIAPGAPPGFYWSHIKSLRAGFGSTRDAGTDPFFLDCHGTPTLNRLDSDHAMRQHWYSLYNQHPQVTSDTLHDIRQRPLRPELAALPSDAEIVAATRRARPKKAPGPNEIPVEFWKALVGSDAELLTPEGQAAFAIWKSVLHEFWGSGSCHPDWLVARLKMLFKGKGNRSDLNRWRGLALLDTASKVTGAVISARLTNLLRQEGLEEQNAFTPGRGCNDGGFSLKYFLQKRREHGLPSWVVFVDLEKAFDTVSREALWKVLHKFGLPDHLINLIIALHTDFSIKIRSGLRDIQLPYTTGVKQGDSLAPVLFNIYFQACIEVLDCRWNAERPFFCHRDDSTLTGRDRCTPGTLSTFYRSLYADDGAFILTSRKDLDDHIPLLFTTLQDFGLKMHIGRGDERGKTEAMFFPAASDIIRPNTSPSSATSHQVRPPRRKCDSCPSKTRAPSGRCSRCSRRTFDLVNPLNKAPILVDGGFVHFTDEFKYLGSIISEDLTDDADCNARIRAAAGAFGALRSRIFQERRVPTKVKRMAYQALVLNVLLFGCEAWSLSSYMLARLTSFHNRCIRSMLGYTLRLGRVVHKDTGNRTRHFVLRARLRLPTMRQILARRRLQWLGHVFRMPSSRLPRRLLFSWLPIPRPVGRPRLTFGHSIRNDLDRAGLDTQNWPSLAANRSQWRALLDSRRMKTFSRVLAGT